MACTTIRRSLFVSTGFRQQPCGLLGILCCTWHAEYYSSSVMVSCFDADSMPVQQPVGKFTYMAGGCVYVAITGGTVVQPCVNSHWLSQWEPCIFDPPQNRCPLTKSVELVQLCWFEIGMKKIVLGGSHVNDEIVISWHFNYHNVTKSVYRKVIKLTTVTQVALNLVIILMTRLQRHVTCGFIWVNVFPTFLGLCTGL